MALNERDMIKLGIIGMSEGNAHPYSWSSIINGKFDGKEIAEIGYPAVADYLEANRDTIGMDDARVTCVWTQDKQISESIAQSSGIELVAINLEDMIGKVDAILLMRDDPENHVKMARPFIDADIPVFIDKPLASNYPDLAYFSKAVENGKFIMSSSSMRYANECRIAKQQLNSLGDLHLITAVGKKDWFKYGVHMLEAVFALLDDPIPVSVLNIGKEGKAVVSVELENGTIITLHLFEKISGVFQITLFGEKGKLLFDIKNSYSMFRDNIIEFIRSVKAGYSRLDFEKTKNIISTLIAAKESRNKGGKSIVL